MRRDSYYKEERRGEGGVLISNGTKEEGKEMSFASKFQHFMYYGYVGSNTTRKQTFQPAKKSSRLKTVANRRLGLGGR